MAEKMPRVALNSLGSSQGPVPLSQGKPQEHLGYTPQSTYKATEAVGRSTSEKQSQGYCGTP